MNFETFDKGSFEEYAKRAKSVWGNTDAYKEYEKKCEGRSDSDMIALSARMMEIFCEFGKIKNEGPKSVKAQVLVKRLQEFISENYYSCTKEILSALGKAYGCGGEFTRNINKAAGEGTAEFVANAIDDYCG